MQRAERSAEERWTERVGPPRTRLTPSVFPDGASVVIYRPAPSAMTSGRARAGEWKLRFERRNAPYIEPLMGWTGCDDTLAQVELTFPSAEAAIAYAQRQGLPFVLRGMPMPKPRLVSDKSSQPANPSGREMRCWRLEWVERTVEPEIVRWGWRQEPGAARLHRSGS